VKLNVNDDDHANTPSHNIINQRGRTLIGIPVQCSPNGKRHRLPIRRLKPIANWKKNTETTNESRNIKKNVGFLIFSYGRIKRSTYTEETKN